MVSGIGEQPERWLTQPEFPRAQAAYRRDLRNHLIDAHLEDSADGNLRLQQLYCAPRTSI